MRAFVAVLSAMLLAACSAPAAPSPTQAPAPAAKPTSAPAAAPAQAPGEKPAAFVPPTVAAEKPAAPSAATVASVIDGYYQKARASGENKVVAYGGLGADWDEVFTTFTKTFPGISAEKVNLRGPEMIQRLQAEAASGKQIANVVGHGQTTMSTIDAAGMLTEWEGPPTAAQIPRAGLTEGKTRWSHSMNLFSAIMNTQLVPADKTPVNRQILLDPFFKGAGKLLIEDPRAGGPGLDVFTVNYLQLGQPFLDAIKAQEPTFVRDRDNAPSQIARGEFAVFYPVAINSELLEMEKAAPVKVVYLTDGGMTVQESTMAAVKGAPGQDAAKLFISWLLSEDGQKIVVEKRQAHAALPGIPPPNGMPSIESVNPSKRPDDAVRRNNEYIEIFDKTFFR